ncbi:MAG: hypothetical protein JWQ43_3355 [Glaciihabitans sp.]|nr:hypothetical protein [Glaciihabitans sp.]
MRPLFTPGRRAAVPLISLGLVAGLLTGCSAVAGTDSTNSSADGSGSAVAADATVSAADVLAANQATHDDADDYVWDDADVIAVTLDGDTASSTSDAVSVDGSVLTITAAGTYELTGTLTDGQVVVNSTGDGTVRLILNGVDISNSTGAALVVTAADEAMVVLADGSENFLADTDSYADDADANAALYSAADLTITGEGALTVTGSGNDGIASADGLVINSGDITVTAVDDGIRGKDYLVIDGGTVSVDAGGDGLKSDNSDDETRGYISVTGGTVTVTAGGDGLTAETDVVQTGGELVVTSGGGSDANLADDVSAKGIKGGVYVVLADGSSTINSADDALHTNGAIQVSGGQITLASGDDAVHADSELYISGGTVDITASYEGLESASISIAGGDISVVASDDGVNAAGGTSTAGGTAADSASQGGQQASASADVALVISGGTLLVDADGDGLDSNGTAAISGGTVIVSGPIDNGNGALDVDGTFDISGGTLLAAGSTGMAVSPSTDSTQSFVAMSLTAAQPAGTVVQLVDDSGTVVASYESTKDFQSVVFSSAGIVDGAVYSVYVGGTATGDAVGGYSVSGDIAGATENTTVTAGDAATSTMGGGGQGGVQGEGPRR